MAEKEYIEREATIEALKDNVTEMESDIYYGSNMGVPKDEIEDIVNEIPAADVVEVVRCKDCTSFISKNGVKWCEEHSDGWGDNIIYVDENDFCSYGERMIE